jgi:hypothetical protein
MDFTKKTRLTFAVAPVVLVLLMASVAQIQSVYAWDGCGGGYFYPQQPGPYSNGYSAGIADAVYDHDNNLAYNPVGQCLSCHSQVYWDGFHKGYDQQWSSYTVNTTQEQSSTQGASINIYGNNYGDVSVGQSNTQGQTAGLGHIISNIGQGLCHLISCGVGQQQVGYGGQYP